MQSSKIRVVIVEPEYPENLGMIARACKNFACTDLYLVNPKTNRESMQAVSRAVHAQDVLAKAKITSTLSSALKGIDYSIAATARLSKNDKFFRKALSLEDAGKQLAGTGKAIALVFGRESSGLTNEEVQECDLVLTIPTSHTYRSLNISHAVALCLYEFYERREKRQLRPASKALRTALMNKIQKIIDNSEHIDNKQGVGESVKGIIMRAPVTEKEVRALFSLFQERHT